jgi:hypothetical protein
MSDDGLAIVLTALSGDYSEDLRSARLLVSKSKAEDAQLDDLLSRARELTGDETTPGTPDPVAPQSRSPHRPISRVQDWASLVDEAEGQVRARGTNPSAATLDDLLDPDVVADIERRFSGDFTLRADLDRYDVIASVAAGIVAALLDFLVVRIPKDTLYRSRGLRDEFIDRGSPLTKWMHSHSLPHDNPLSEWCKTSFDAVSPSAIGQHIDGLGPKTHRVMTLGHDPLLGLVFGTMDILRGSLTAIDRSGSLVSVPGVSAPHQDPVTALLIEVLHLLSDAFTKMGVPVPGWTLLGAASFGSLTSDNLTVAQTARQMYLGGYDSRHFLTMATSPAAAEAILRGYWVLRKTLDDDFSEDIEHLDAVANAGGRLSAHPRYQAMSFIAHLVGCAANAGKIAVYSNPLALNYAQWLAFVHSLVAVAKGQLRSPTDVLVGHARANAAAIERAWPDPLDCILGVAPLHAAK